MACAAATATEHFAYKLYPYEYVCESRCAIKNKLWIYRREFRAKKLLQQHDACVSIWCENISIKWIWFSPVQSFFWLLFCTFFSFPPLVCVCVACDTANEPRLFTSFGIHEKFTLIQMERHTRTHATKSSASDCLGDAHVPIAGCSVCVRVIRIYRSLTRAPHPR